MINVPKAIKKSNSLIMHEVHNNVAGRDRALEIANQEHLRMNAHRAINNLKKQDVFTPTLKTFPNRKERQLAGF